MAKTERKLTQVSETLWISSNTFSVRQDGSQLVSVCVRSDSGELVALDAIISHKDGTYSYQNKFLGAIGSQEFTQYLKKFQNATSLPEMKNKSSLQNNGDLFKQVSETYTETGSIKKTAKHLCLSEEKTRRVLFTLGKYTCDTYEKIQTLLKEEKALTEIAATRGLSQHQIRAYLPYSSDHNAE